MTTPAVLPQTIGQVIDHLDHAIERCIRERSRLGYFATLYRNVTARVRDEIAAGRFEDGRRMERLDVIFANRYLDALYQFWRGAPTTASWSVAFRTARLRSPIILQHILLGMNAHINLDLAIAAVETCGCELAGLERDFNEITVLLGEMIDGVQERINLVSPWFRLMDRVGGARMNKAVVMTQQQVASQNKQQATSRMACCCPQGNGQNGLPHVRLASEYPACATLRAQFLIDALMAVRPNSPAGPSCQGRESDGRWQQNLGAGRLHRPAQKRT
jgi:hypothetical protein